MRPSFRPPDEPSFCPPDCPYRENDDGDIYGCDSGCRLREDEEDAAQAIGDKLYDAARDDALTDEMERGEP